MDPTLDLPESDTPALDAWLLGAPMRSVMTQPLRKGWYQAIARQVYVPMFVGEGSTSMRAMSNLSERLERADR